MLHEGQIAPDFTLPDAEMEKASLSDFRGRLVVVYFYPRDNTPGCTLQAVDFSDRDSQFARAGAVVLGISGDSCESHVRFRDAHGLTVRLLSDPDHEVCAAYDVWREREIDGAKRMAILRSTFVIDGEGVIRRAQYDVTAKGHAADILSFIRTLSADSR